MKTLSINFEDLKNEFTLLNDLQLSTIKGGSNDQGEDEDDDIWMND
ncbi:hypothetical protein ACFLRY_01955 [Bacteroidota bacterium]